LGVYRSKKLVEPGWAGLLTLEEAEYIRQRLEKDAKLRRAWGIRGKGRIPLLAIAVRAFPEDPAAARLEMKSEMAQARRRERPATTQLSPNTDTVKNRTGGRMDKSLTSANTGYQPSMGKGTP
jgi:hypothetical protein